MAKFTKGQSGNPKGRPPGTTSGTRLRKAIEDKAEGIIQVMIDAALNGDIQAGSTLLSRIIPTLKSVSPAVEVAQSDSLTDQGKEIIKSSLSGAIPPDVGAQLLTSLANQAKLVEMDELIRRIELLEGKP